MRSFFQAIVSGLVTGSIYALMTVGMTLDLRHAAHIEHGARRDGAWSADTSRGCCSAASAGGPLVGLVGAAAVTFVFGVLIQQVAVRPLIGRSGVDFEMTAFISTFAVAIVLSNVALEIYGARNKAVPPVIQGDCG